MVKRPRGKMTAAEHEAWLKATGKYDAMVERQRQRDAELEKREADLARAEAPLVEELRAAGYSVNSVWDLVNSTAQYRGALPILLKHLVRPYPVPVREGIARALAVRDAKCGWKVLVQRFKDEQDKRAKDGLAVAIAAVADDELIGDVIALARDTRHGATRILLLSALERSRDACAHTALMELRADLELEKEIQAILRRIRRIKR